MGGMEMERPVDLATIPLYVRAGSILPLGPARQFSGEKIDKPLVLTIYPGADASFLLYEDDGRSFNYRQGEWMGIEMTWTEAERKFSLRLAPGSRMLSPTSRAITVKLANVQRNIEFKGQPIEVLF
jgi:alpha-glucosidase (family GH31 glycosyl hydrolase)